MSRSIYDAVAENEEQYRSELGVARKMLEEKLGPETFVHPAEFLAATTRGTKYIVHAEGVDNGWAATAYATVELLHD